MPLNSEQIKIEMHQMKNQMKDGVKQKAQQAREQLEELVMLLKQSEFFKNPKIQNLIQKVEEQISKKESETKIGNVEAVESGVTLETNATEASPQVMEDKVKNKQKIKNPRELLDLIKTSDVANKIAQSVLKTANEVSDKWIEKVEEMPLVKKLAKAQKEVQKQAQKVVVKTKSKVGVSKKKTVKKASATGKKKKSKTKKSSGAKA